MSRPAVAIVQEYVPRYRVDFFGGLVKCLGDRGVDCFVLAGRPSGAQAVRGDATGDVAWLKLLEPKRLKLGSKTVSFYGTTRHWSECDAVILELRGTSIDLHMEILKKKLSGRRVGVWGHVKPYIKPGHSLDLAIERRQMICSDRVFAYNETGAAYAISAGVDPARVTNVMNSTDVSSLLRECEDLNASHIREFRATFNLTPGKSFGYIGGLDESKRIDFLAQTLDVVWEHDREVRVVIGGSGDQKLLLSSAVERGQAVMLGFVGAAQKALIAASCEALLNPGRVGLIAVECMATGLPILTTDWPFHAPEYEYLKPDQDVFVASNTVEDYAALVLSMARGDFSRIPRGPGIREYPSLAQMIVNFADGVEALIG